MKKKVLVFLLASLFTFSGVAQGASLNGVKEDYKINKKNKQVKILEKFQEKSEKSRKELKVDWNKNKEIPTFITGDLSEKSIRNETDAVNFLNDNKDLFNLEYGNFQIERVDGDELGTKHYRGKLFIDSIPVYGTDLIVHTDKDGNVYSINGQADDTIPTNVWNKKIKVSTKKAIKIGEDFLGMKYKDIEYTVEPTAETYLYNYEEKWQVVQVVTLQFMGPNPSNWRIFVNAETGNVIDSFDALAYAAVAGTGVGVNGQTRNLNLDYSSSKYYLTDLTKGATINTYNMNNGNYTFMLPGTLVSDTDNNFNSAVQGAAVDAHYNIGVVYDYYKNNFNRNSYDNAGATIKSSVHFGSNYNNAFWNGSQMVYGDGDGSIFNALSGALDVVAHEFTHAVTEKTANLEYRSQPGALNESMSDILGYLVEGDINDWQMGEDCYTPNTPGDALRDLQNPELGNQPAHMNDYETLPETESGDWGGVHINSGIPNKAFYLAATTINDNSKIGKIYYRALTAYLTETSQFTDARAALLQSATDLYGENGVEYNAIKDAFTQVGIGEGVIVEPGNDTFELNNSTGAAYGPITSGTVYDSYIYSSTDVDYYYFNTGASGTITVSLTNLPKDYDVQLLNSAGTVVAKSQNASTTNESISYSATAAGKYYVKVLGYSGDYSTTTAYALKVTYPGEAVDTTAPVTTTNPAAGTYTSAQTVTLTANEAATTYYTVDGTTPTTSSAKYTAPIAISTTTTLKFFSVDTAGNVEAVKTANYTIELAPVTYEIAYGTAAEHYTAGRLTTSEYLAMGTKYGYITKFNLYRVQGSTTWTDVQPQ